MRVTAGGGDHTLSRSPADCTSAPGPARCAALSRARSRLPGGWRSRAADRSRSRRSPYRRGHPRRKDGPGDQVRRCPARHAGRGRPCRAEVPAVPIRETPARPARVRGRNRWSTPVAGSSSPAKAAARSARPLRVLWSVRARNDKPCCVAAAASCPGVQRPSECRV